MEQTTQAAQYTDLAQAIERELAAEHRTEDWKVRAREASAAGDVIRMQRLLRLVNRGEA